MHIADATRLMPSLIGAMNTRSARLRHEGAPVPALGAEVRLHSGLGGQISSAYVARPRPEVDRQRVLVAVHGISRDAQEQVELFGRAALSRGWTVVAPLFDRVAFPAFQQLGLGARGGLRADLALLELLDELGLGPAAAPRLHLFGHSGGAQFAHRFALVHPQRVAALALGSAGWYTLPTAQATFPHGLRPVDPAGGPPLDLQATLSIPCRVFVGTRDTRRDPSLNRSARIDREQGSDRVARARGWIDAMRAAAERAGAPVRHDLELLPRCCHAFAQCATRGALVERVLSFFARADAKTD